MQKLYALILLLAMALVACTPAAQQQDSQNLPVDDTVSEDTVDARPRFIISHASW